MPKIVQYNLPPGGTHVQVADNVEVALDIETTAGEDWILIDTENGAENMVLAGGNYPVMIGADQRGPRMRQGHGGSAQPGYPVYTFRGDTDTGMTHLGTSNDDALSLVAGGVEIARAVQFDSGTYQNVLAIGNDIADIVSTPRASLHVRNDSTSTQAAFQRDGGVLLIQASGANITLASNEDLRLEVASTIRQFIDKNTGNVGIGTTDPGQILDVNQGSGNMIADGYDTHSLASYKENLSPADSGYLAKVTACPPKQWTSVPYVSADEIKAATIEQFGQDAWDGYFPEDDSHRAGALLSMPEGEMKTWIDAWAESKREERRLEEKWQQVRLGLVADADDTAANFPESVSKNTDGEISGINTMSYIGTLHAALIELAAKVEALEGGD